MSALPTLLLVEPEKSKAARYHGQLRTRWNVVLAETPDEAARRFNELEPAAVLIRIRQIQGHGLELCQHFRGLFGGQDVTILIYGRYPASKWRALMGDDADAARRRWGYDDLLRRDPTGEDLATLLRATHQRRAAHVQSRANRLNRAPPRAPVSARSAQRTDPPPEALSWPELLRADVNARTVRAVLKKDLLPGRAQADEAPPVPAGPQTAPGDGQTLSTEEIPWRDLLTSEANAKNIGRVLRKQIHLGGRPEQPDEG